MSELLRELAVAEERERCAKIAEQCYYRYARLWMKSRTYPDAVVSRQYFDGAAYAAASIMDQIRGVK